MSLKNLDIRIKSFDENGEEGTFTAYGNVKWIVDRARECTIDNCFKWDTNRLPKMLVNHDFKQVCGVWTHIEEDEHGLKVHGKFAINTTLGRETYELVKMGALDSLSIGYVVNKERYDHRTNVTYLEDITIHEVSVVTFECNQGSLIEDVKSDDLKLSYKSIEPVAENQDAESQEENQEHEQEQEEPVVETALNKVVDEEQETETESKEEIPTEVMQKLDNLVISLMLSKISF
ncbi:HK97 family phage prohead protease [Vibrio vulnificus]|nr:HK97 family phage prohead protease [Vibrio vulnificus]